MARGTPNALRYYEASRKQFDWIRDGGIYNCRHIAGTDVWSQHAFENADDAMTGPNASTTSKRHGDELVDWLLETVETTGGSMKRYQAFGIRTILWWGRSILTGNPVSAHRDHVHVDFWPRGSGSPPCAGGRLIVRYPDGSSDNEWALYPNVTIKEEPMAEYVPVPPLGPPPHEYADQTWDAFCEDTGTDRNSRAWNIYREDFSWHYTRTILPLKRQVKKLQADLATLSNTVDAQTKTIASLANRVERLEAGGGGDGPVGLPPGYEFTAEIVVS